METTPRAAPRARVWYLAFLVSWIGILAIPFYNAARPALGGFPLFYWYQFALVVLSAIITWIVHVRTLRDFDVSAGEPS